MKRGLQPTHRMNKSILICGVGGQGILLASNILSKVALESGVDVKKSEVHGMAQRGGNVTSAVKFGEKVYSPLIGKGEADILLSFEKLEALRNIMNLKPRGISIVNDYEFPPMSVTTGAQEYPKNIIDSLKRVAGEVIIVPAFKKANELGNPRVVNIILLGSLAKRLDFPKEKWLDVIKKSIKPKFLEINLKAFDTFFT